MLIGSPRPRGGPPSHYRFWAAFRGIVYLLILLVAVLSIPRTTLLGWGATVAVIALFGSLSIRWLYAAVSGRLRSSMLRALDDDQTMGSV